jgi:hypothetical protein
MIVIKIKQNGRDWIRSTTERLIAANAAGIVRSDKAALKLHGAGPHMSTPTKSTATECIQLIHHVSIPAREPRHVAEVLGARGENDDSPTYSLGRILAVLRATRVLSERLSGQRLKAPVQTARRSGEFRPRVSQNFRGACSPGSGPSGPPDGIFASAIPLPSA